MDKKLMLDWLQNQKRQITGIDMLSRNITETAIHKSPIKTSGLPDQSLIDTAAKITAESKLELDEATEAKARRAAAAFLKAQNQNDEATKKAVNTGGTRANVVRAAQVLQSAQLRRAGALARRTGYGIPFEGPKVSPNGSVTGQNLMIWPSQHIPNTPEAIRTRTRLSSTDRRLDPISLSDITVKTGFNARRNMTDMLNRQDALGGEGGEVKASLPYVSTAGNNRLRNSIRPPQAPPSVSGFSRLAGAVKRGIGSVVGRFNRTGSPGSTPASTPTTESPLQSPSPRTTQKRLTALKTALRDRVGRGGGEPSTRFEKLMDTENRIASERRRGEEAENNRRSRAEDARRNAAHLNTGRQGADE